MNASDKTAEKRQPGAEEPATILQNLVWPEPGICTEAALYVRLQDAAGFCEAGQALTFGPGGRAGFDTWFNLFSLGKWTRYCALTDLVLDLRGEGDFELSVWLARPGRPHERICCREIRLEPDAVLRTDLSRLSRRPGDAVLFFELAALSVGRLEAAVWRTRQPPRRLPDLAVVVTTFRREAAAAHTARRFAGFAAGSRLAPHLQLLVVDNGRSAVIEEGPQVTYVPNENLGGAGGFARGLIEARRRGASHCLFMDDDAAIHMESLTRTWSMLAHAIDPTTAVAGAMIDAARRWEIWESGAVFDRRCIPQHMGVDLRDAAQAIGLEFDTTGPAPRNFYGGWWYFAFPLAHVRHMPFPFFVRGDDVSFSLAHAFRILTLNGVVSFQDSFIEKESPLTWYLDLRSHLAHHLSLPHMRIGAAGTLKIAVWFYLRNFLRLHYESLSAINLALEDVIRGPDFFAENAGLAQRRAEIKALTKDESWGPYAPATASERIVFDPRKSLTRILAILSLNGHFLPFFPFFGNRRTLTADQRGNVHAFWGAARVTISDAERTKSYTVRHCKRSALRETWRFFRAGWRFLRDYDGLCDRWQAGYLRYASDAFWTEALGLDVVRAPCEPEEPASGTSHAAAC